MKAMLSFEFSRLFKSKSFYLAIFIGTFLSVWLVILAIKMNNESLYLLAQGGIEDAAYFFPSSVFTNFIGIDYSQLPTAILFGILPIIVAIPFASSFCNDRQSGYVKNVCVRTNKKNYFAAKYIVVLTSGVIVTLSIFLISILFTAMFIPALYPQIASFTFPVCSSYCLWSDVYRSSPYLYLLFYSLIDGMFFGAWSTVALALSIFVKHRFTVVIGSTVLYFSLCFFLELLRLQKWNPELFLRQYQPITSDLWIMVSEVILILAITYGVFMGIGVRKDVY